MVEKGSGTSYSIGHLRIKYLDLANMSFAQNDFVTCKGYIDDFMDTVDAESDSGKMLKEEFDKIYASKKTMDIELDKNITDLGYFEQKDAEEDGRRNIEINSLHDIKETCWRVSLKHGLFYD